MQKKYKKLKTLLFEKEIKQADLCAEIKKSQSYLTSRMSGHHPFDLDVVYAICDFLEIRYVDIPEYFPRGGVA